MLNKLTRPLRDGLIALTLATAVATPGIAAGSPEDSQKSELPAAVSLLIRVHFPGDTITSHREVFPGIHEVAVGGSVINVSADARYLFSGDIIDLPADRNLTEITRRGARATTLAAIDPANTITFGPENPKYSLFVFTDTDCGYCQLLHQQIDQYIARGIEINYLFYPRAGNRSRAYQTAVSIWCADDRKAAMTKAKNRESIEARQCDNPVLGHMEIANELGVNATPVMFLADGTKVPGYVPPEKLGPHLERLIAENK